MQIKYHFIYKTINIINNKFYCGMHSTYNLEDGYIGSGKWLWYSIRKYGKENFRREILEFCDDRFSLELREKEIVNSELLKDTLCMNLKEGGSGGWNNETIDHYEINKKRNLLFQEKLKNDPEFKTVFSTKMSATRIEKQLSLGKNNPMYGTSYFGINKEGKRKRVPLEELQNYINSGWSKGFTSESEKEEKYILAKQKRKNERKQNRNQNKKQRRKSLEEEKLNLIKEQIIASNVNFGKIRWTTEISKILGIVPGAVARWMRRNMKEFYEANCRKNVNNLSF